MTTNELTQEQVTEYEAQSAAGKVPVHPGWHTVADKPFFAFEEAHALHELRVFKSVYGNQVKWVVQSSRWGMFIGAFTGESVAKLAAEDLLRIDTACLHQELWRDVKEELPEYSQDIMLFWEKQNCIGFGSYEKDHGWVNHQMDTVRNPTHWRPLPKGPHE